MTKWVLETSRDEIMEDWDKAEARFIEQRDSLVSVTKKLAKTEAKLTEEQRISTLRGNTIEFDLIPSLSDARAAIPYAYQMALDAAAKKHGDFLMTKTKVPVEAVVASEKAIRALIPPADLVQQVTKEGE